MLESAFSEKCPEEIRSPLCPFLITQRMKGSEDPSTLLIRPLEHAIESARDSRSIILDRVSAVVLIRTQNRS